MPGSEPSQSRSLTPEQRDTAGLLRSLLGNAFADRFLDFCRITNGEYSLRVSMPLAAHSLRELESSLRSTLRAPFMKPAQFDEVTLRRLRDAEKFLRDLGYDGQALTNAISALQPRQTHADEIKKIGTSLGLAPDGEVVKSWLSLVGRQQRATHMRSFHEQLVVDGAFRDSFQRPFVAVVREIVLALRRRFSALIQRVDELTAQSDRDGAVRQFKNEIPGAMALQRRFYERIDGPEWLPLLARAGLLAAPVPNFDDSDAGVIRWNEWAPGHYLLRMAKSDDHKIRQEVVDALRNLADAEDFGLRDKCFEIATAFRASEAAPLAETAASWLGPRYFWSMQAPEKFVRHLIDGGEGTAALTVSRALLGLERQNGEIVTKYDHADYEHFLPGLIAPLVGVAEFAALDLFCDLLERAAVIKDYVSDDPPKDYTSLSNRIAITDDTQSQYDTYWALVTAVRMASEQLIRKDKTRCGRVVATLVQRRWHIFQRLALHAAAMAPAEAADCATGLLKNADLIGQGWCEREYGALAIVWFPHLRAEHQADILTEIEQQPARTMAVWSKWFEEREKRPPTEAEILRCVALSRQDAMWHWRSVLPEKYQREIAKTSEEYGLPWAERSGQGFAWNAIEESPLTAVNIVAKPIDELVGYLMSWKPAEDEGNLTVSALGTELRNAVETDPVLFASRADAFATVGPLYTRRLIEGLANQVRNARPFNWEHVLDLLGTVVARAGETVASADISHGEDPNRMWVLLAALELIRAGLYRGPARIPQKHALKVWEIIAGCAARAPGEPLIEDYMTRFNRDPYFAAQSTLAGAVLECAILYAWWVSEADERDSSLQHAGISQEVSSHIEEAIANTGALAAGLRGMLGRYSELLTQLDPEGTQYRMARLLDVEVSEEQRSAVWIGYLLHNGSSKHTWRYFAANYEAELQLVGQSGYDDKYRGRQFVHHLLLLFLNGEIELDGMLSRFLVACDTELREHAAWFLLQNLQLDRRRLPDEQRERVRSYYESRVAAASRTPAKEGFRRELGMLGVWFGKTPYDDDWMLRQLLRLSSLGLSPSHPSQLFEWMESRLADETEAVIACIELILLDDGFDQWMFAAKKANVRKILEAGVNADEATVARSKDAVNILVSRGLTEFLDLVR